MTIWKPIHNYEDLYEINNHGVIRSIHPRFKSKPFLKPSINNKGYKCVTLCRKGTQKSYNVHRLVAETFIPNPDNLPCINHIDEDKTNNDVSNLEWCSYYYNNTFGQRLAKSALKRGIPVKCVETGIVYTSAYAASRETKISQSSICKCCHGNKKTAGKLHWVFV